MKVCHVFPFFSIKAFGGTCDLMYKIVKAQVNVGLKPTILTGNYKFDSDLAANLRGCEIVLINSYLDKYGFSIMPSLNKTLRSMPKFDVVHFHVFRTYQNIVVYNYCREYNIPLILDAHGAVPYAQNKVFLKKRYDNFWGRKILSYAKWVVAETQVGIKEYLEIDRKIDKKKMTILSPPFDTDEFKELPIKGEFRKKNNIKSSTFLITFLGRIHYLKGNDFLIKGFNKFVKDYNTDSSLVFIGNDDGHMSDLRNLVDKYNLNNYVRFVGFLGGKDKNSALIDSNVVAQLSRQEQGAWAPFEAILCGTPIVVTQHTGSGEDVRRIDAGKTIEFDDIEALANYFHDLYNNYDEYKLQAMKAKKYIEDNLSFNQRVNEYTELYQ